MWIRNRVLVKFSCWIHRIWQIKAKTKLIFRRKETTHESIAWNPGSTVWPACTSPMVLCTYYCQYYRSNQGSSTHKVTSTPPLLQAAIVQNLFVKAALCCLLLRREARPNPQLLCLQHCLFLLPVKLAVALLPLLCTTNLLLLFSILQGTTQSSCTLVD